MLGVVILGLFRDKFKGPQTCLFFVTINYPSVPNYSATFDLCDLLCTELVSPLTTTCAICLSPLMLWVRISIKARCTTLCDKVCQWLATVLWFSPGPPVSSTNKIDRHNITEILLKVALNIYIILFRKYCLYMVYWFSGQIYFHNKIFSYVFHIKLLIFKTFSPYQIFLKFSPLKVTLIRVIFF